MFENLTDKLERSFKVLKGEGRITEINVAESLKEIRRALIDADVNYKVAKTFTDEVKAKALGQDVLRSVKPGQLRGAYFDHVGFLCIKSRMGIRRNLLLHFTKGLPRCKCIMDRFVI